MKLVIHNGSRIWGGNEKWLTTVALGLRARGHEVVVSCRTGGPLRDRLEQHGVATSAIRPGGDLDVPAAVRFARWLRRERPDALLLTSWNRTPWAVWAARRARVPRVVVRLGIVRSLPPRGRYTRAFRNGVDALIVNSSEIRTEWLRSAPWFPAERVRVVLNGIDPLAPVDLADGRSLRRELGLEPEALLVAGAGHVTPRKGFDLLLDAVARLGTNVHLAIIGTGPQEEALRRRAGALGIAPRVHWLGRRADVPRLLAQCDVFVLSSRNEGMANVMLEAMAAGVPVVATAVSGAREALDPVHGRPAAGWVVPPEDAGAISAALERVLAALRADPELVRSRVAEAHYRIQNWFTIARMAEEIESMLFAGAGRAAL